MIDCQENLRRLNLLDAVSVYCDGGMIDDGKGVPSRSEIGGTWAWIALDVAGQRQAYSSGVLMAKEGQLVTSNMMEWWATIMALEALPAGWQGTLYSDSQVTLGRLRSGWTLGGLPRHWIRRGGEALRRASNFRVVLLQGHPSGEELAKGVGKTGRPVSQWNVWCDEECSRRAREHLSRPQLVPVVMDEQPLSWE